MYALATGLLLIVMIAVAMIGTAFLCALTDRIGSGQPLWPIRIRKTAQTSAAPAADDAPAGAAALPRKHSLAQLAGLDHGLPGEDWEKFTKERTSGG